jgi:hypothetical protein
MFSDHPGGLPATARPKMYKLRADLFQRGTETQFYSDRLAYWIFLIVPAQAIATKWLERFNEFPHRARAASFQY